MRYREKEFQRWQRIAARSRKKKTTDAEAIAKRRRLPAKVITRQIREAAAAMYNTRRMKKNLKKM